jgi:hypothetical protein
MLTAVAFGLKADVLRTALAQRHPDLKNQFYELFTERGATPDESSVWRNGEYSTVSSTATTFSPRGQANARITKSRSWNVGLV